MDLVLASRSSDAAPAAAGVMKAPSAPAAQKADAPATAVKPEGPPSELVAYVHVPDCVACNACAEACPTKAITVVAFSQIDPNICGASNECGPVCPTNCISLQPRGGYARLDLAVKA